MTDDTGESLAVTVGGDDAFEEFYRRLYGRLVGLAYTVGGSRSAAEDIVHDALEDVLRGWATIALKADPEAWVKRIVINRSISAYRRRRSEWSAMRRIGGRRGDPAWEIPESADHIWAEVRRLPRRQIQVVALRYVDDLTLEQIGEVIGASKETVNTHLRRAKETLSRALDAEDQR